MSEDGLIHGLITEESLDLMRERIGYPNPTLRGGILAGSPWVPRVSEDSIWRCAISIGDGNPLFCDPEYAAGSRWGGSIAQPGLEMAMGWDRNALMDPERARITSKALRGVHLFHSGSETFYWGPLRPGTGLYKSQWVDSVEVKTSQFAGKSAIVTNQQQFWDEDETVRISGSNWFVHTERRRIAKADEEKTKKAEEPAHYDDAQLAEIEAAYDNEYVRGKDTLYYEDVEVGQELPRMAKGPFTITDLINLHMGLGWLGYGNPPFRLAYENRKKLRGFYSKDQHGVWDTIQRIHWDLDAALSVGVLSTYDVGPLRQMMINHYLTNYAGDDGFVHRVRSEFRAFNYVGDTTWLTGKIVAKRVDPSLGPLIEVEVKGTNQRGKESIRGAGTILVATREGGLAKMPSPPQITQNRAR